VRLAIIVGSEGQDGTLLAAQLQGEGMPVRGLGRNDIDIVDFEAVRDLIRATKPDEIYYLAAYHHSSEQTQPDDRSLLRLSLDVHVTGLANTLESIRCESARTRILYAASSHIFGNPPVTPQNEDTPIKPLSIYGITKACGVHLMHRYREAHRSFASVAILYNHESSWRPARFLSQKIIQGAIAILEGRAESLRLGDLSARVDWGYAPDYVDAMIRIIRHDRPDDFVVATGETHTVGEFARTVFALAGLDVAKYLKEDPSLLQKEQLSLAGDSRRLRAQTGWKESVTFERMIAVLWNAARKNA
jgi:GDPmannose 4,6-dehydratase